MKHLTKTLAVVSLFAPITAQPLGIGDIELHSALNQKLNAEIRLQLAPSENPADISVRMAPPEKFDKAGVPWNYFLSKIKFKAVEQPNGTVIIKVTSNEVLTEPFLDFLLEVTWPQGSQFREFTVLLDPPTGYQPPLIPSATAPGYQIEPIEETQRPVRKPRTAKRRIARAEPESHIGPQTPSSGEYGPVPKSDTLWSIAKQLGSERGVPTSQMMNALFRANPEAFNRNDINALKAGVVLKIPETDAILQAGKAPGEQKVARKESTPSGEAKPPVTKALELEAPVEGKVPETAKIAEQVKPGTETGQETGTEGTPATGKDTELQDRIDRLEQQLNMMQQLLALKDQQLAAIQSKDAESAQKAAESAKTIQAQTEPAPEVTEQQPVPPTPPVQPTPEVKPQVAPSPKPHQPKPRPTPAPVEPEPGIFSSPAYSLTIGGLGVGMLGLLGWLWWRKRKVEEETSTDSMFASASQIRLPDADSLSVPVMDMGASGTYDVGTVGESSFISDFTPSDFEAFDTDQSEVDPMSEADVYLAYGRYQQAEDLIRHAIAEQPDKDDYKLKLLEIFYANEDKDRFAAFTQELVDEGKNANRPFWAKVSDMGKEIIPESPLFGGAVTAKREPPEAPAAKFETDIEAPVPVQPSTFENEDNLDFDTDSFDQESLDLAIPTPPDLDLMDEVDSELNKFQQPQAEEPETDNSSLDFDLSAFSEKVAPPKQETSETIADIESIDFDLEKLHAETPAQTDDLEKNLSDTLESFDFNFDLEEESPSEDSFAFETAKTPEKNDLDMANLESFDFSSFESVEPEEKPSENKPDTGAIGLDTSDEFDFNFDFEAPRNEHSDEEIDLSVSDLTDMDEFETKIDLAKAYIDMGDAAAAKAIAEEVLEKGTKDQKQAAQTILDELK